MKTITIAFDVDGTLVGIDHKPIPQNVQLLTMLGKMKNVKIVVWSGGGRDYAEMWGNRLQIPKAVKNVQYASKRAPRGEVQVIPDITFDDQSNVNFNCPNIVVEQDYA